MKLLITGRSGLAAALARIYQDHQVTAVSRATGHDIADIMHWGQEFLGHDMVVNCAYHELAQISVLDFFFDHWQQDASKILVTIGSRVIDHPRIEQDRDHEPWPYRAHKQALQQAWNKTARSPMKSLMINPGPIDSDMTRHHAVPKMDADQLAKRIRHIVQDGWIRRADLWL